MTSDPARPLPVPQRYRAGLIAISNLADDAFERVLHELEAEAPTLDPLRLVAKLSPAMPDKSREAADSLVKALLSTVLLSEALDTAPEEVAQRLSQSRDLELTDDGRRMLLARIGRILAVKNLMITAKGVRLLSSDDKTFHDAKVVTDIRPVFTGDVGRGPAGALIVHSLIVEYHETSAEVRQETYSLDSSDVRRLQKVLERANAKADALNNLLDKTGISVLRLETGEGVADGH